MWVTTKMMILISMMYITIAIITPLLTKLETQPGKVRINECAVGCAEVLELFLSIQCASACARSRSTWRAGPCGGFQPVLSPFFGMRVLFRMLSYM